jgi:mRNA interferase RelE/StbE
MYSLVFEKSALRTLRKLPKEARERIFRKLQETKESPFRFFERLAGRPEYKLRVGDYRVIADIDKGVLTILVLYVGHRSNVYERI